MRVPNLTSTDSLLRNLRSLDSQQLKLQQQASDGQKITTADEDPTNMSRVLSLETDKREMVQYRRNAGHALDVANASFAALQKMEDLVARSTEIARLTSSGLNPNSFATYAKEVEQIRAEALVAQIAPLMVSFYSTELRTMQDPTVTIFNSLEIAQNCLQPLPRFTLLMTHSSHHTSALLKVTTKTSSLLFSMTYKNLRKH